MHLAHQGQCVKAHRTLTCTADRRIVIEFWVSMRDHVVVRQIHKETAHGDWLPTLTRCRWSLQQTYSFWDSLQGNDKGRKSTTRHYCDLSHIQITREDGAAIPGLEFDLLA
jgi:hypothetical protein